jgi:hypothetical protein
LEKGRMRKERRNRVRNYGSTEATAVQKSHGARDGYGFVEHGHRETWSSRTARRLRSVSAAPAPTLTLSDSHSITLSPAASTSNTFDHRGTRGDGFTREEGDKIPIPALFRQERLWLRMFTTGLIEENLGAGPPRCECAATENKQRNEPNR